MNYIDNALAIMRESLTPFEPLINLMLMISVLLLVLGFLAFLIKSR